MKILPTEFEGQAIRRSYNEATETWWFSVVDVVQVLTQQSDDLTARKYWNQLKRRLEKEGSQLVTICHQLKMPAADGKQRLTDVATAQTLLRLVQSIPSPKAEPIKLWLAKVGYERMQEMADPALSLDRARQTWQQHGRSDKWIQQRMTGQETRNKLTDYWRGHDIKEGQEPLIGIADEDLQGLMSTVQGASTTSLDLILHSPGGSPEAAESIVHYLRDKFSDIRVLVPHLAMSAATMISCAANKVVMGDIRRLGQPIRRYWFRHHWDFVRFLHRQLSSSFSEREKIAKTPQDCAPGLLFSRSMVRTCLLPARMPVS